MVCHSVTLTTYLTLISALPKVLKGAALCGRFLSLFHARSEISRYARCRFSFQKAIYKYLWNWIRWDKGRLSTDQLSTWMQLCRCAGWFEIELKKARWAFSIWGRQTSGVEVIDPKLVRNNWQAFAGFIISCKRHHNVARALVFALAYTHVPLGFHRDILLGNVPRSGKYPDTNRIKNHKHRTTPTVKKTEKNDKVSIIDSQPYYGVYEFRK
jgi:hypothetical protein